MIQCYQYAQHNTVATTHVNQNTKSISHSAAAAAVKHMDQKYVGHPERYM